MSATSATSATPDPFLAERDRLWGLAYRVCGMRTDADDVVQDAWIRWQSCDRETIDRPAAWLTTVTSRLAIDRLRQRRRRAEHYVGPWLPEMIDTPPMPDPSEMVDSLTVSFLTMLERLEPIERVVFLLADVFGEPFSAIAATVARSESACRQIASRARKRVRDDHRHRSVSPDEQQRLASAFGHAVAAGNLVAIADLLAPDAVLVSDGGAAVHAARRPVIGRERVARFTANLAKRLAAGDVGLEACVLNGEPALKVRWAGELRMAIVFHVAQPLIDVDARIERIFVMRNPDKLAALHGGPGVTLPRG